MAIIAVNSTEFTAIIAYNVLQIGDVADLRSRKLSVTTELNLKTKLNINREPRHIAYVLLGAVLLTN